MQYYTGVTGTIPSFNYGTAPSSVLSASLVTGTRQIANLNYGICIRMEAGYCAIQYSQVSCFYEVLGRYVFVRTKVYGYLVSIIMSVCNANKLYNTKTNLQTADTLSFTVTGDVEGADNTVLGTAVGALNGANCVTDFVVIPNPTVVATGLGAGTDRFCGLGFVPVQSKYLSPVAILPRPEQPRYSSNILLIK